MPRQKIFPSSPAVPQQQRPLVMISLKELSQERNRYIVYPPFQRRAVWNLAQCQQLIDTILLGDPIASLEGYQDFTEDGQVRWGIIDGHQRISAILKFLDDVYKTWTDPQKQKFEPNSGPPVEPGRRFSELSPLARNCLLDYHIHISKIPKRPIEEMVTRFLRIQTHVPLSKAERLHAYPSAATQAAIDLTLHPFWSDFYVGNEKREQIFQCCLYLFALELTSEKRADLKGSFITSLASGARDQDITESLVATVNDRLDAMCCLYSGMQFTERAAVIPMYQSVALVEDAGHSIQSASDKGRLTEWIGSLLAASRRASTTPVFHQLTHHLIHPSAQNAFWAQHRSAVLALFGISQVA